MQFSQATTAPARTMPLGVPLLLYDTRNWPGGTANLENEGALGHDFDLEYTFETAVTSGGNIDTGGRLYGNNRYSFRLPSPQTVVWSDVGGDFADGGWTIIRCMTAAAPEPGFQPSGGRGTAFLDGCASGVDFGLLGSAEARLDSFGTIRLQSDGFFTGLLPLEATVGFTLLNFGNARDDSTRVGDEIKPGLVTQHYDSNGKLQHVWIDDVEQRVRRPTDPSSFRTGEPATSGPNAAVLDNNGAAGFTARTIVVGHVNKPDPPLDGIMWYGCGGFVLLRGKPTGADLRWWRNYFLPTGQTMPPNPLVFRAEGDGVNPVIREFTVPARSAPYVISKMRFNIRGATGGNSGAFTSGAWFEVDVVAGDVIRLEVGGRGLTGFDPTNPGAGGWPDGGNGGLNINASTPPAMTFTRRGSGGGGSTRVFLNGVLILHQGAGGGGGVFYRDASMSGDVNRRGGNALRPPTVVGGSAPGGVVSGNPGTGIGPGSLGSGGIGGTGSAGAGNQGGDGVDVNVAPSLVSGQWTAASGGGGGGGGYFGGGGGGATSGYLAGYGGGGGSQWYDASVVTIGPTFIGSVSAGNSQGLNAWVFAYEL